MARSPIPGGAVPRHVVLIQYAELGLRARSPDRQADKTAKQINETLARGFFARHTLYSVKRPQILEGMRRSVFPHPAMLAADSVRYGIDHTGCDLIIH